MPGMILQIKKNSGEIVKKSEVLFVLEAMKMENEIYAVKDGTMGPILTSKGASVATGDVLGILR
jgi:biotin carboxyl carrier protein